jgi:hypothetical protein
MISLTKMQNAVLDFLRENRNVEYHASVIHKMMAEHRGAQWAKSSYGSTLSYLCLRGYVSRRRGKDGSGLHYKFLTDNPDVIYEPKKRRLPPCEMAEQGALDLREPEPEAVDEKTTDTVVYIWSGKRNYAFTVAESREIYRALGLLFKGE